MANETPAIPATTISDQTPPAPKKSFLDSVEEMAAPVYEKMQQTPGDTPTAKSASDRLAEEAKAKAAKPPEKPAETPKPEPKAADSKADDEIPEVIRKSEKASAHWKAKDEKHNKEMAVLSEKIAAYEKDLSAYKLRPAKEDYEKLVKERDELNQTFKRVAIEKHPEFLAKYEAPMQNLIVLAKQAAGEHGGKIEKLLNLPDNEYRTEQLDKIMEDLSPSKANMLGAVLADAAKLQLQREADLKDHDKNIERIEAEAKQKSEAEKAMLNDVFERTIRNASDGDDAVEAFKERKDDPKWNEGVRERREMARAIYEGQVSLEERAHAALWGSIAPLLLEQSAAQAEALKQKDEEIASLKAGRPKVDGEDNKPQTEPDLSNASVIDRIVGIAANSGFAK